jgi:hypothetical protein
MIVLHRPQLDRDVIDHIHSDLETIAASFTIITAVDIMMWYPIKFFIHDYFRFLQLQTVDEV